MVDRISVHMFMRFLHPPYNHAYLNLICTSVGNQRLSGHVDSGSGESILSGSFLPAVKDYETHFPGS